MKNILLSAALGLALVWQAAAQCADCGNIAGERTDYCFKNEQFAGLCAAFTDQGTHFYLSNGKKQQKINLPADFLFATATGKDVLPYVLAAVNDKSLKISALEALFLLEALKTWSIEGRKYGHQKQESGLGIKVLAEGSGPMPESGKNVKVNYAGYLENGKKFDSSFDRNEPFEFPLGQGRVIRGWDEGIAKLKIGSKAILQIPAELGYGERGAGGGVIPPSATLYFIVEVIGQ